MWAKATWLSRPRPDLHLKQRAGLMRPQTFTTCALFEVAKILQQWSGQCRPRLGSKEWKKNNSACNMFNEKLETLLNKFDRHVELDQGTVRFGKDSCTCRIHDDSHSAKNVWGVCVCVCDSEVLPSSCCLLSGYEVCDILSTAAKKGGSVSTWWRTERMRVRRCRQKSVTLTRADVSGRVCPNLVGGNSPDKREQSTKKKMTIYIKQKQSNSLSESD